ncbi:C2H2-type domain-containing protein [Caenorhabditis elegans]|nr:C2H2-type domain-containing protein [Caenorhabditis elegans]CBM41212.1 C2H2-type domain-containing protein [Caenorhabditis elegans]|eukprot:NP_001251919.1 Uncharacterized protein CELE_K11D2.4 [Caenorhabditis elegans]
MTSSIDNHRTVREALLAREGHQQQQMMVKREMTESPRFSPPMGFDAPTTAAVTSVEGLSALSVVGTMMMKQEHGGGASNAPQPTPTHFTDFDYMNMMQPIHLAAIGRHSSQGGSERHLSTESSVTQAPAPVPTTKRSRSTHDGLMKCQYCPKKVNSEAALERHMSECRMIRPHECDRCGKRFKARGGLQQHMRIHNNEKAYVCTFCAKSFTQKSHLDQHERIHTGVKPFLCAFCGRSFRQRSQQIGHESTHLTHFSTSSAQQTPTHGGGGGQTTPSSSASSGSSGSKGDDGAQYNGMLLHPSPPTPSPEQQQNHLNMAAAVMQMHHHAARQHHEISSLLGLNHEFVHQHVGGVSAHATAHQFGGQQSAAEATVNGMRMLSHIAS